MAIPSRSQIIQSEPIGDRLDVFHRSLQSHYGDISALSTFDEVLQNLPVARSLLRSDLLRLELSIESNSFNLERVTPLLRAILNNEPDEVIWNRVYAALAESTPPPRPPSSVQQTPLSSNTGGFVNSTEHRKYVDNVLRKELG